MRITLSLPLPVYVDKRTLTYLGTLASFERSQAQPLARLLCVRGERGVCIYVKPYRIQLPPPARRYVAWNRVRILVGSSPVISLARSVALSPTLNVPRVDPNSYAEYSWYALRIISLVDGSFLPASSLTRICMTRIRKARTNTINQGKRGKCVKAEYVSSFDSSNCGRSISNQRE